MEGIAPVLIVIGIVIMGNILDKKKPTAKRYPSEDSQLPEDITAEPDIAGEISAQQRKYQEYLNRNGNKPATENYQDTSPAYNAAGKKQLSPMAQAVSKMARPSIFAPVLKM